MIDLRVDLGKNLVLSNPVLTASGTFGYGDELVEILDINRFGGIVTKSLSLEPRIGNPSPRIVETVSGMINSIGLANIGLEAFLEQKKPFLRELNCKVIVNIAAKTEEEFGTVIQKLDNEDWIAGYEINVSCPNVKEGGIAFGTDSQVLDRLTQTLRKTTKRFLIIKLSPNVTDIAAMAKIVQDNGADAVSLINTVYGAAIDIYTRKPKINTIIGGLSGPAIKPIAVANIIKVQNSVDIPIIGIGGISSGEDVVEFILAGASAVQLGTINFMNPYAVNDILEFLRVYMKQQKLMSISDLIGRFEK
ncbi:dihydroorotate dehydrogenase [bacterium]|nr:dihydroorotate dehydrogenase [bacterium]MBU1063248.1 dihydroorotate dehydrogenase [bacterium]MBU1633405.1 dihydroorotate dehydrogenase [bacterium]MBU1875308.1 dihydroorotate dehydrogenase [bacterium]